MSIELIPGMSVSASGLEAERLRMEITAGNLANIHSTRDVDGGVYQRRQVVFAAALDDALDGGIDGKLAGVEVSSVIKDQRPPQEVYAPYHPDADENGMVRRPNISPIEEMVDMMTAARAYEANLAALKEARKLADQTIALGKASG